MITGGMTALTAFAFTALAMAKAAAFAAFLTGTILSPTAARTEGNRTIRYGSTDAEVSACSAMAWMALRARSRTLASFLLASCFLRDSTVL